MSSNPPAQFDTLSPGRLLRAARLEVGLSEREMEDLLNLAPGYVRILERDDYQALRSPAFARGYVRAYGRQLGMDLEQLLRVFDQRRASREGTEEPVERRSQQRQHAGLGMGTGIGIGLVALLLLVSLWWWQTRAGSGAVGRGWPQTQEFRIAGVARPAGE